jgi:hypothetical protein
MIDHACIAIVGILWCAIRKYMLLVTKNRLKTQIDGLVDDDMTHSGY